MNNKVQIEAVCPHCRKKTRSKKAVFCPDCGHGLYTPRITGKWSLKLLAAVLAALVLLYILYIVFEPAIYFALDKVAVPH